MFVWMRSTLNGFYLPVCGFLINEMKMKCVRGPALMRRANCRHVARCSACSLESSAPAASVLVGRCAGRWCVGWCAGRPVRCVGWCVGRSPMCWSADVSAGVSAGRRCAGRLVCRLVGGGTIPLSALGTGSVSGNRARPAAVTWQAAAMQWKGLHGSAPRGGGGGGGPVPLPALCLP